MKQWSRSASLVVVLVVASFGTAAAECAWIRWTKHWDDTEKERWVIGQASASKAECVGDVERAHAFDKSTADKAAVSRSGWTVMLRDDGGTAIDPSGKVRGWRHVCLPDTIDPRGPQEK